MSVHTKKDGRVFTVNYEHGKQIWESFGRGPEALATAKAYDLELKLKRLRGELPRSYGAPAASFHQIAQLYLNARRAELSNKTRSEILRLLSRPEMASLMSRGIRDITLLDWIHIQDSFLARGTGNRTINIYFRYLMPIFKWCVSNQYLTENPWRDRTSLKQAKYHIDLLTVAELQSLMNAAPDHLKWALTVAYYTGMRPGPSELFAARWEHVDWENKRIHIYASKTKTWRWQYLLDEFLERLKERHAEWQEQKIKIGKAREESLEPETIKEITPYIITYRGQPVRSLKTSLAETLQAANITKNIRLYDLRHLHITHALAAGAPIGELAERVGHTDTTMIVKVYAHMVEEVRTKQAFTIPSLSPAPDPAPCQTPSPDAPNATSMPANIRRPLDTKPKKGAKRNA